MTCTLPPIPAGATDPALDCRQPCEGRRTGGNRRSAERMRARREDKRSAGPSLTASSRPRRPLLKRTVVETTVPWSRRHGGEDRELVCRFGTPPGVTNRRHGHWAPRPWGGACPPRARRRGTTRSFVVIDGQTQPPPDLRRQPIAPVPCAPQISFPSCQCKSLLGTCSSYLPRWAG